MLNLKTESSYRHSKTILNLMHTLIAGQDELNEKGYFRYVAALTREKDIKRHCEALDYFVEQGMIDFYRRKQIKGKSSWYIEVHKN